MMQQLILNNQNNTEESIRYYFEKQNIKKILFVHGKFFLKTKLWEYFKTLQSNNIIDIITFSDFSPNPDYESAENGQKLYIKENCDAIVAAGGGSCIDVAKYIRIHHNSAPFLVIPTTSGTGSEATKFAVIYYHGEKKSISNEKCIPDAVYFDSSLLSTVPIYHKKATILDALCHGIESFWSINSTKESIKYSKSSIKLIWENLDNYLANDEIANHKMLIAANLAGKAINITQTTAGHAMCYKLTKLYGYAHGHAAALCNVWLWHYMLLHMDMCIDYRGQKYLENIFYEIANTMGYKNPIDAANNLEKLIENLELSHNIQKFDIDILSKNVNLERLKNNPIKLDTNAILQIYTAIYKWQLQ